MRAAIRIAAIPTSISVKPLVFLWIGETGKYIGQGSELDVSPV
jgi:hypothetical protein